VPYGQRKKKKQVYQRGLENQTKKGKESGKDGRRRHKKQT